MTDSPDASPSMVERVARIFDPAAFRPCTTGQHWDGRRKWAMAKARAAIAAMREPTSAMLDSGVAFALSVTLGGDYRWTDYVRDKHSAMIDAALADPGRGS